jgi:hypothetical protein
MKREVWDWPTDTLLRTEEREPECGEDFCDRCGCCLVCVFGECCKGGCRWIDYERFQEGP